MWPGSRTSPIFATGEGWLYLAGVLDLGSRRLLGYSMDDHMRTELVTDALGMALAARGGNSQWRAVSPTLIGVPSTRPMTTSLSGCSAMSGC